MRFAGLWNDQNSQRRNQETVLRDFDHRYGEIDITAGPHNFVMQYELVRIFHNADRNTEFHRATCLAFRDPPRVRLKDGEYLFVLWDCLALEKTPVESAAQRAGRSA